MREQGCLLNNVSLGASINSTALLFDNVTKMSLHSIITGSPVGEIKLQCSNDLVAEEGEVVNWIDYDTSATAISAAGQLMTNLKDVSFKWLRMVYTRTSGSGSITTNFYSVADGSN